MQQAGSLPVQLSVPQEALPGHERSPRKAVEHQCTGTGTLRQLDLGPLFDAFKGIARLEARIVTLAGQFKATLKRPARVLAWGR